MVSLISYVRTKKIYTLCVFMWVGGSERWCVCANVCVSESECLVCVLKTKTDIHICGVGLAVGGGVGGECCARARVRVR